MRIAWVLGQSLASAAGVGREPDSGALGPAGGSLLVAVPPGSRGRVTPRRWRQPGRRQVPQVNSGHFLLCRTVADA